MTYTGQPPLRLLVLSDLFPTGESPQRGSFVGDRLAALTDLGVHVDALALRPQPTAGLRALLRASGRTVGSPQRSQFEPADFHLGLVDYVRTSRHAPSEPLIHRVADRVMDVIGERSYDVIAAHGMYRIKAGLIAREVGRRLRLPYVLTLHGSDVNVNVRRDPHGLLPAFEDAAATVYVSRALRDAAQALGAPQDEAHVLSNGVDVEMFGPGPKSAESPVVAFVGGLAEVKGADRLPGVFKAVNRVVPEVRFEIVGSGALRAELENQMAGLDVTWHGHVSKSEVASVMARCSVLVVPSRSEGWGCVVLEAHASECFVVATRVGGLVESVGDERYLVPEAEGPEGLAKRVVEALEDHPGRLRERALEHSWRRVAEEEVALLRSLALH